MKTKLMLPLLAIAAFIVTPASANWFHNPYEGINRNIGSAPNPTPDDIRAMRIPIVVKDENNSATDGADRDAREISGRDSEGRHPCVDDRARVYALSIVIWKIGGPDFPARFFWQ